MCSVIARPSDALGTEYSDCYCPPANAGVVTQHFFYQVVNMPLCYQLSDTLVITMSTLWYASRHHVYELEEALVLYGQTQGLAM